MTEKVNKPLIFQPERLRKLAGQLRKQKKNECFKVLEDDNHIFSSEEDPVNIYPVFECIVNVLPKAFPEVWKSTSKGITHQGADKRVCLLSSIIIFFGIDGEQFMHIFTPYAQEPEVYGGAFLERDATPKDIARNISEMICFNHLGMDLHPAIPIFISKN